MSIKETQDLYLKHDAMHIKFPCERPETDFEWWYFDAALDNGEHLVVMYSTNDTRLYPRQPSVRTNIYETNGHEVSKIKKYGVSDVSFDYEKCDVRMGEEWCKDCGGYYEIFTNIDGYGARLKFMPLTPSWVIGKDEEEMAQVPLGWTVALPGARVEGVLIKDGKEISVKGSGYHDHNWGFMNVGTAFKNWYWGKIHTEDIHIDYIIMVPKEGNPWAMMLAVDADRVVMDPTLGVIVNYELGDYKTDPVMGYTFANNFRLKGSSGSTDIDVEVTLDHIVMRDKPSEDLASHAESAYRYIAHETTKVRKNGMEKAYRTSSLHEIVYLPQVVQ